MGLGSGSVALSAALPAALPAARLPYFYELKICTIVKPLRRTGRIQ